jgi:hypothetical protein
MDLLSCSEHLLVCRQGVYYLSVAAAGFLVFIIVLAILKGGRNYYLTNIRNVKEDGAICNMLRFMRVFILSCYHRYLKLTRCLLFFVPFLLKR